MKLIIAAVILALAIVGYGYFNYQAKIKQLESERLIRAVELGLEDSKNSENQRQLKACLDKVNDIIGNMPKGISYKDVEVVMDITKQKQADCYKLYPVK